MPTPSVQGLGMGAGLIRDRYEPLAVAGRGGQGEVLRARDRLHDRIVAIKRRHVGDPSNRTSLLAEARILLKIPPHPSLCVVREDFFDGDQYCLVLDWIEGETLQQILDAKQRSGLGRALAIVGDVASALDHLHAHGVVHRDVKPANIIVTPQGRAVLVDLGIAGADGGGARGTGTRGYVAPEISAGEPATTAADVFGLAATAYAVLTGAPPRAGARPRWKGIPTERVAAIDAALRRALSMDPTRRHEHASDLVVAMTPDAVMPNNLPVHLSSFVGRETDVADVVTRLRANRLVTLTGPGGIGKTRLASAVAAELLAEFPDGAWFVDLSTVTQAPGVEQAIADALGVRETAGASIADALSDHVMTRSLLLVLDNCEHLVDACADVVAWLMRGALALKVLATSRERLGLAGEAIVRVPGLPVDGSSGSEAFRLFVERARLVHPGYAAEGDDADAIASICERLDGIPLAIELAAARISVLSATEIARRLDDRLRLLTVPREERSSGRRCLRAVLDWSYDLLADDERSLLRRLSVFVGGWTLDAAEAVVPDASVLDLVSALVDKSLVIADDASSTTRYSMLETIRSYAADRLRDEGEDSEATGRFARWCLSLAEEQEPRLEGREQHGAMDILEAEHDNIRAMLSSSLASGDAEHLGARTAASMWRFWDVRGYLSEGRRWLEGFLQTRLPSAVEARVSRAAGGLALDQGDYDAARTYCTRSLEIARASADMPVIASALNGLAIAAGSQSDFALERALYEESLPIWRQIGNLRGVAITLGNMGTAAYEQGALDEARALLTESLAIRRDLGDRQGIASSLNSLALVAGASGDHAREQAHHEECLAIWRDLGYRRGVAVASLNMGVAYLDRGDAASARPLLEESAEILRELGIRSDLAEALHGLGEVVHVEGDTKAAELLLNEALSLRVGLGDKRGSAMSMEALARIRLSDGDASMALSLIATADRIRSEIGVVAPPASKVAETTDAARTILGEAASAVWTVGASMTIDDVLSATSPESEGTGPEGPVPSGRPA